MKSKTALKICGMGILLGTLAFNLNACDNTKETLKINPKTRLEATLDQKVEQYTLTVKITNAQGEYIKDADIKWLAYIDGVGPLNKEDISYKENTGTYSIKLPAKCEYVLFVSAEGYEPTVIKEVKPDEKGLNIILHKR